jgi:hypothetical protein
MIGILGLRRGGSRSSMSRTNRSQHRMKRTVHPRRTLRGVTARTVSRASVNGMMASRYEQMRVVFS